MLLLNSWLTSSQGFNYALSICVWRIDSRRHQKKTSQQIHVRSATGLFILRDIQSLIVQWLTISNTVNGHGGELYPVSYHRSGPCCLWLLGPLAAVWLKRQQIIQQVLRSLGCEGGRMTVWIILRLRPGAPTRPPPAAPPTNKQQYRWSTVNTAPRQPEPSRHPSPPPTHTIQATMTISDAQSGFCVSGKPDSRLHEVMWWEARFG